MTDLKTEARRNILIQCPTCNKKKVVPREKFDPPRAVRAEFNCGCESGGFDLVDYFDADGKWCNADPETFS
jgi:hypothetical protein